MRDARGQPQCGTDGSLLPPVSGGWPEGGGFPPGCLLSRAVASSKREGLVFEVSEGSPKPTTVAIGTAPLSSCMDCLICPLGVNILF